MKPKTAIILSLIGCLLIIVLSFGGCGISAYNSEVDLRKTIQAKNKANEASLDTMWKIIQQKAQISEKAVSEIKDMNAVYGDLVSGREGGSLFKMVSENHPNLGQAEVSKLMMPLMVAVEAERKTYKRDQQALIDLNAEREKILESWIKCKILLPLFGADTTPFVYRKGEEHQEFVAQGVEPGKGKYYLITVVTSTKTQKMIQEAAEDDIDLFKE